jgi:hypothetical protein
LPAFSFFGIFSSAWITMMNLPYLTAFAIAVVCVAAFGATAAVWSYKPSIKRKSNATPTA